MLFFFPTCRYFLPNHVGLECNLGVAVPTKLCRRYLGNWGPRPWLAAGTLQGGNSPNTYKGAQLNSIALPLSQKYKHTQLPHYSPAVERSNVSIADSVPFRTYEAYTADIASRGACATSYVIQM